MLWWGRWGLLWLRWPRWQWRQYCSQCPARPPWLGTAWEELGGKCKTATSGHFGCPQPGHVAPRARQAAQWRWSLEIRSLPNMTPWVRRSKAIEGTAMGTKRMKPRVVSFSSHGLCGSKHPACTQAEGKNEDGKVHGHTHPDRRGSTETPVKHYPEAKQQHLGPALEGGRRPGPVLQGHWEAFTPK